MSKAEEWTVSDGLTAKFNKGRAANFSTSVADF